MISNERLSELLDLALAKNAPDRIPRSGPAAKQVDCFTIRFELNGQHYLLDGRDGKSVKVRRWNHADESYVESPNLSIFEVLLSKPNIVHFYGEYDLTWDTWEEFSQGQRTGIIYWKVRADRIWKRLRRAHIARKKLVTIERARALNAVWELQSTRRTPPGSVALAAHIYGQESPLNPSFMEAHDRLKTVLEGLVQTNDLSKNRDLQYAVTGQGAQTLEKVEEDNTRHRDAMRLQSRIVWLTVVLALVALLQAKVVDLPPLMKIERWPWSGSSVERCAHEA